MRNVDELERDVTRSRKHLSGTLEELPGRVSTSDPMQSASSSARPEQPQVDRLSRAPSEASAPRPGEAKRLLISAKWAMHRARGSARDVTGAVSQSVSRSSQRAGDVVSRIAVIAREHPVLSSCVGAGIAVALAGAGFAYWRYTRRLTAASKLVDASTEEHWK